MDSRSRFAAAGALAAGLALAVAELAGGLITAVPSLVQEVGDVVIDNVPTPVKDWAISVFGVDDKLALIVGIVVVTLLVGAATGVLARRRLWAGVVVFAAFGALGAATAIVEGEPVAGSVIGAGIAALSGLLCLAWLYGRIESDADEPGGRADTDRRAFITGAGAVIAVAALSAGVGRLMVDRTRRMVAGRDSVVLPVPVEAVRSPPATASFPVDQLSSLVTSNAEFYRIDTALSVPRIDLSTWTLQVHGMVDVPYSITFDELLEMDMVERYVTLSCVSNQVGGTLVDNAKWLGVPLTEILDRAGVQDGASQIVGRADGFTVGFPTAAAYDGRDALVAVGMNDEPLPFEHGFPARLVVAGLYGYVSATKWLTDIELTTWGSFDAYWVPRGWSKEGPVKTQSRIDTPRHGSNIRPETRAIAGVAWAPNVGIERVEVQIDEGEWLEAELAEALDKDTWRQWMLQWTPTEGDHRIRVRATDASGYTQTVDRAPPAPNGATGWHTIGVSVGA